MTKNMTLTPVIGALPHVILAFLVLLGSACGDASEPDQGPHEKGVASHADDDDDAPGDEAGEEHGEEGVQLTETQVKAAGIVLQRAGPGTVDRHITLPAVVKENGDTLTHVNPKAPGIVRSVEKHLGDVVQRGELLCVIDSGDLGKAVSDFIRGTALVEAAQTTLARESALFAQRLQTAEIALQGAIEINEHIRDREQQLSEKAVSTIRPLLEAEKALQLSTLEKDRVLIELGAERDARLLLLEVTLAEREIEHDAARNTLLALGLEAAALVDLTAESPLVAGTYEVRASRDGIIVGRHITTGEFVDAATKLYTLTDLSQVWILASAFESQVSSVRTGQPGRIHLDAFPDLIFEGEVTLVGFQLNRESRALPVRLVLDNLPLAQWPEEFPLRPGMFGSVDLIVESRDVPIVLPESAVVHDSDGEAVFVHMGAGQFERRPVDIGPPAGAIVEILAGVKPGEEVAVSGTFQLKSALGKGELGEGHDH